MAHDWSTPPKDHTGPREKGRKAAAQKKEGFSSHSRPSTMCRRTKLLLPLSLALAALAMPPFAAANPNIYKRLGPKNQGAFSKIQKLPSNLHGKMIAAGDRLMSGKKRTLETAQRALNLYEGALQADPEDLSVRMKCADAANTYMRIATNANTILIEGGLDTRENKKLWAKMGPKALEHATAAYRANPGSVEALSVYADSFMFSTSSKGIMAQAVTGAGNEFKRIANELRKKFPNHDSAVGSALLGCFYAVAPWPVGDKDEAMRYMDEAAQRKPSRRNLYYVGVVAFKRGEWSKAAGAFEKAISAPCGSKTEQDFGDFMIEKSKEGLKLAKARMSPTEATAASPSSTCGVYSKPLDARHFSTSIWTTLAYMCLYYVFLNIQAFHRLSIIRRQKKAEKERAAAAEKRKLEQESAVAGQNDSQENKAGGSGPTGQDGDKKGAQSVDSQQTTTTVEESWSQFRWDRSVGNMLEQQGPFLWGLWLNALFCGEAGFAANGIGMLYVATRVYYPLLYPLSSAHRKELLWLSTMPGYAIVACLWAQVASITMIA